MVVGDREGEGQVGVTQAMFVSKSIGMLTVVLVVGLCTDPKSLAQVETPKQPTTKENKSLDSDVRKLLGNPDPQLRLRAALTLAARQDEEAIGVLIDLL